MNLISIETAVDEILQACEDEAPRLPFFFLVGAGISHPSVPLASEIEAYCRELAMKRGRRPPAAEENPTGLDSYSYWFEAAYPQAKGRQRYLRNLIVVKPISHANLRLAHLLSSRKVASLVVTPNFDDHLSRALDLFGVTHILCDHPRTVERIDPELDDIQVTHVHGTYSFYDCCNLRGEIEGRAQQASDTTATMAFLLDSIITARSPLVVGYSGWEGDVIMSALRRRLSGRRLGIKIYWFCYHRDSMNGLPPWLDHQDVAFVVPPEPTQQAIVATVPPGLPNRGLKERGTSPAKVTPDKGREESVLPAQVVFDSLIRRLNLSAPDLTADPISFFARQVRASLPGDVGASGEDRLYFFQRVVRQLEEAKELLNATHQSPNHLAMEQVRDTMRRSQYRDVIRLIGELDFDGLDPDQCHEMIEATRLATRGLRDSSEDEVRGYSLVVELSDHCLAEGDASIETLVGIATALVNRAVSLGVSKRTDEELRAYDQVVERFGNATEASLRGQVARALVNKGLTLGQLERHEEGLSVYDEVVKRFSNATEASLREQVARALFNKGWTLGQLERHEEGLSVYDQVVEWFGNATEVSLRERVAWALFNKGWTLSQLKRHEEGLSVYDEVVKRFGDATEVSLRERVAWALFNKGWTLGHLNRHEEERSVYDQVVERFGSATEPELQEQTAQALANRAWIRYEENDIDGFLTDTQAALSKRPSLDFAAYNLGLAFLARGRDAEAIEAYRRAANDFPDRIADCGLSDLEEAKKKWLSTERAQPVISLLESLRK
jgi:tetratricopeptide (TPR) repeat protein